MQATSTIFRRLLLIVLAALLPLVALLGLAPHQQFQRDRAQALGAALDRLLASPP